jgi:hypothetical protein
VRLGDTSGPPASTLCSAIASDPADRTYVAGRKFEGPFVVRLLQDGRIDWRTTVRPAGSESTISALGVVGGLGTVVVGPVLTSSGWKGWAALLSDSGDVQWIVNFEGESSEFIARDLTIGADDHIYVAATSHDVLGLVILDSKGNLVDLVRSSATEGGSVDSAPAAVTSTSFGRIVAAASADTPGTSDDILVVSIDLPAVFRDGFEGGDPSGWAASDPRKKSCGGRHDELGPDC